MKDVVSIGKMLSFLTDMRVKGKISQEIMSQVIDSIRSSDQEVIFLLDSCIKKEMSEEMTIKLIERLLKGKETDTSNEPIQSGSETPDDEKNPVLELLKRRIDEQNKNNGEPAERHQSDSGPAATSEASPEQISGVAAPAGTGVFSPIEEYQVPAVSGPTFNAQVLSSIDPNLSEADVLKLLSPKELRIEKRRAVGEKNKAKLKYSSKKTLFISLYTIIPFSIILSMTYLSDFYVGAYSQNVLEAVTTDMLFGISVVTLVSYICTLISILQRKYNDSNHRWNFMKVVQDIVNAESLKTVYDEKKAELNVVNEEIKRRKTTR